MKVHTETRIVRRCASRLSPASSHAASRSAVNVRSVAASCATGLLKIPTDFYSRRRLLLVMLSSSIELVVVVVMSAIVVVMFSSIVVVTATAESSESSLQPWRKRASTATRSARATARMDNMAHARDTL